MRRALGREHAVGERHGAGATLGDPRGPAEHRGAYPAEVDRAELLHAERDRRGRRRGIALLDPLDLGASPIVDRQPEATGRVPRGSATSSSRVPALP